MSRRSWYKSKYPWLAFIIVLSAGGVGAWRLFTVKADKPLYLLGSVDRGDIAVQVTASGTLSAVTTVQVGSQVSGNIAELYADFNSSVKRGRLLARLDPQLFESQVQQSEANVRTAEITLTNDGAGIAGANANLEKARVDVIDKGRKLNRQKELYDNNLSARDDLETAQAVLQATLATQSAAEAQLESAEAGYEADEARLQQARAGLQTAKLNLEHTMIYSPISGTIISRSVDRGQTVAASMSAPTLFTIGEDLTEMQIVTNIDEADVGRIKTGMPAEFTVDAYPEEVFAGKISQIRLSATTVQNVVTYNAIFNVQNPQQRLKPGMTANVKILIARVTDVLRISNSALRFKPAGGSNPRQPSGTPTVAANGQHPGRQVPVWVLAEDKSLRSVAVQLGLSDGLSTELVSGPLVQGDIIVTGMELNPGRTAAASATTQTPKTGGGSMPPPPPL